MKEAQYGKQICSGAQEVSVHTHGRDLHRDAADGDPGAASCRDRRVGTGNVRPDRGANEEGRRRHRATQGRRSDGMGRTDEQHLAARRGGRSVRVDLLLRCVHVRTKEKRPGPGALRRRAPAADLRVAGLPEQASGRRQAHGGRKRAAVPADEVKLNNT